MSEKEPVSPESGSRREFVARSGLGVLGLAAGCTGGEPTAQGPNILFVFADQMRAEAMGCMGNSLVQTPNLDRLASQGLLLTDCYSGAPVCTPYRAQLMTGRYSHSTGVVHNDVRLGDDEVCVAEVLRSEGYKTGYIGKWHLDGGRMEPKGTPRKAGFVPTGEARQGWEYWAALECDHEYFRTSYYTDTPEPIELIGYEPATQTDLAINFIERNQAGPFCLFLSWGPPHGPYEPPRAWDLYAPEDVPLRPNVPREREQLARRVGAQYYGLVSSLDYQMGRLMKSLDDFGIAGDTVVVFTSDHGDMLQSHGEKLKQKPWAESAHVPFIIRYPERIDAGGKSDLLLNSVDLMPTLLGFAGAQLPDSVEGRDWSASLAGKSSAKPDSLYMAITSHGRFSPPPRGDWRGIRTDEWLYARADGGPWLLHNVREDPFEMDNGAGQPRYSEVQARLDDRLKQWISETGDPFQATA